MAQIQLRRDTAANWAAANPVLAAGELGLDLSSNLIKLGDGITPWNSIGTYINSGSAAAINLSGTYAARPAPAVNGRVYYCTDCDAVYQDTGTSWAKIRIGDSVASAMADPPTTGWTGLNMTGATWAANLDGMALSLPAAATTAIPYQYRAYPTPPFTLTAYLDWDLTGSLTELPGSNVYWHFGIAISDGTKYLSWGPAHYNGSTYSAPWYGLYPSASLGYWPSGAGAGGWYGVWNTPSVWLSRFPRWWRVNDDGTNLNFYFSTNGFDWHLYYTQPRLTYLAAPTRIGFGAWNTSGYTALFRLRSWVGAP